MQRSDLTQEMADNGLIEVLVCPMALYENGDAGLAADIGTPPEFWCVELCPTGEINGSSDPFEEHTNLLSEEEAFRVVDKLREEFPNINVEFM